MRFQYVKIILTSLFVIPAFLNVAEAEILNANIKKFTINFGVTRIIYNSNYPSAEIQVENPQEYPILIQSEVFDEDKHNKAPFIVTPPLLKLDEKQKVTLKIIKKNAEINMNQESLYWFCVKGIPPLDNIDKENHHKSELNVNLSISSCNKLIYRPSILSGTPENDAGKISWRKEGNKLIVSNPTPYYMNFYSIFINGHEVSRDKIDYISPYSNQEVMLPKAKRVEWKVITDYGGESQLFSSDI
ncbi:P pilus assembly chaperone PapD [Providencia alcalifaciens]|uniref:P pilus assembly chaperone PapD n=1 Tax=Providencia alcalifaciens TaxID=126385 RepID=A0A4R3NDF9_9GAMM|nr:MULTISPECIES: fimbria/pilus periplasmic chaperone [Providencia]MBC5792395.1 fimbria/pilus periplasmic chaperone [Providencia sp. JUb39]TCT28809.1 P pilus assembly chaperone PapD [Providencia alcalifaciens]